MRMRLGCVTLALLAYGLCGCVPFVPNTFEAQEDFGPLTAAFDGITAVQVDWRAGAITVTIDDTASELSASGTLRTRGTSQAAADAALADIDVTLAPAAGDDTTAVLAFTAPTGPTPTYAANVELTIPAGVTLTIESAAGNITVTGNSGSTTIDLAAGNVTVTDNVGATNIEVATGDVAVVGNDGDVRVDAATGTITVETADGSVEVAVNAGAINIDSTGTDIDAAAATGEIDITARLAAGSDITAATNTGDVVVRIPADYGAEIDLNAGPVGNATAQLTDFDSVNSETITRQQITATLNAGGATISATASVGNVTLTALN